MKFWMQMVSSPLRLPDFIRAAQAQVDRAADPGTIVEVHGTTSGALAPTTASSSTKTPARSWTTS